LYRLTDDAFNDTVPVTIGVEFGTAYFKKNVSRSESQKKGKSIDDSPIIKAQIWDCAGQYKFQNIVNSYFHQADIIFFIFDLTSGQSYVDLKKWIERADVALNGRPHIKCVIGNKLDLANQYIKDTNDSRRIVETLVADSYAKSIGADYYVELSAKESTTNASDVTFESLLEIALDNAYLRYNQGEPLLHETAMTKTRKTDMVSSESPQSRHRGSNEQNKCCSLS
jgi:GTPase SAR1 family protein